MLRRLPMQAGLAATRVGASTGNPPGGERLLSRVVAARPRGLALASPGEPSPVPLAGQRPLVTAGSAASVQRLHRPLPATAGGVRAVLPAGGERGEWAAPSGPAIEHPFPPGAPQPRGTGPGQVAQACLQRQGADDDRQSAAVTEGRADAAVPSGAREATAGFESALPGTLPPGPASLGPAELAVIADEVYEMIEERLTVEKESRGL